MTPRQFAVVENDGTISFAMVLTTGGRLEYQWADLDGDIAPEDLKECVWHDSSGRAWQTSTMLSRLTRNSPEQHRRNIELFELLQGREYRERAHAHEVWMLDEYFAVTGMRPALYSPWPSEDRFGPECTVWDPSWERVA